MLQCVSNMQYTLNFFTTDSYCGCTMQYCELYRKQLKSPPMRTALLGWICIYICIANWLSTHCRTAECKTWSYTCTEIIVYFVCNAFFVLNSCSNEIKQNKKKHWMSPGGCIHAVTPLQRAHSHNIMYIWILLKICLLLPWSHTKHCSYGIIVCESVFLLCWADWC